MIWGIAWRRKCVLIYTGREGKGQEVKCDHDGLRSQIKEFEHYPEGSQESLECFKLEGNVSIFVFQKHNFGSSVESWFVKNAEE